MKSNAEKNSDHPGSSSTSFANQTAMLQDEFINSVTEPFIFCVCIQLDPKVCKRIDRDLSNETVRRRIMEILTTWYDTFQSLEKKDVLEALRCSKYEKAARQFKQRHEL